MAIDQTIIGEEVLPDGRILKFGARDPVTGQRYESISQPSAPAPTAPPAPATPAPPITAPIPVSPTPAPTPVVENVPVRIDGTLYPSQQWYDTNVGGGTPAPAPAPIPSEPVPQPAPAPPATTTTSYTIASGDTLSEIAAANGTTVEAIMAANPQITDPNMIYAGQSLNMPANGEAPILPTEPAVEPEEPVSVIPPGIEPWISPEGQELYHIIGPEGQAERVAKENLQRKIEQGYIAVDEATYKKAQDFGKTAYQTYTSAGGREGTGVSFSDWWNENWKSSIGLEEPDIPEEPEETPEEIEDQSIDEIVDNAMNEWGIDLAAQDWLNFPEFSFENVISDLLEGMGWSDLQSNINSIQEELDTAVANRDEAVATIRENPWLDQSMQLGRIGRTQDKARAEITRLQNKLTLATNTATRVEEKAELYAAKALTQYSAEKEYAKDKYDYLLQRAKMDIEAKLAEREEIKAEEQWRYTEATKAPDNKVIDGVLYERDPYTGAWNAVTEKQVEVDAGEEAFGLTPTEISSANYLAKQLYGASAIRTKDGYNNFVVPILQRMAAGENIDDIADTLRFQGQSVSFTGAIRAAAQQITSKLSANQTETVFDKLDDIGDDTGKVRDYLKKIAIDYASGGTEQAKTIMGSERTVEFLDEIYQDLADFEAGGGDTNIFTGTLEAIAKKAGLVKDPELRRIATKITKARQQYRRAMTGVAFSPGENKEYDAIFPNIDKTAEFNTATIDGLREAMRGDVDFFYSFAMGSDAYQELFKGMGGGISDGLSDEEAYQEYLNIQ